MDPDTLIMIAGAPIYSIIVIVVSYLALVGMKAASDMFSATNTQLTATTSPGSTQQK
jgi:hypothetical protein